MSESRVPAAATCRQIVLIHGAWQGKWAFDPWLADLHARGWQTHAIDLPGNGWPPGASQPANLATYTAHVVNVVEAIAEPVIVLGHSGGGVTASQLAEAIPDRVAGVVYLAGLMLPSGVTAAELIAELMRKAPGVDLTGIASWLQWNKDRSHTTVPLEGALRCFFQDCEPEAARKAAALLTPQPQTGRVMRNTLTNARFGRVPRVYVECRRDMSIPLAFQRYMQELCPGALRLSLDCGHVPQLAQPRQLTALLMPELEALVAKRRLPLLIG